MLLGPSVVKYRADDNQDLKSEVLRSLLRDQGLECRVQELRLLDFGK